MPLNPEVVGLLESLWTLDRRFSDIPADENQLLGAVLRKKGSNLGYRLVFSIAPVATPWM